MRWGRELLLALCTLCLPSTALTTGGRTPPISARVGETVGVIIVDHGSRRAEANDMLHDVVRKYHSFSSLKIVEPAHMELSEPSIETAFRNCVERGASVVICHPFFLSRGRHVQEDIPALMAKAAEAFPGVQYSITGPLGMQDEIIGLVHASVAAAFDDLQK